MQRLNCRLSNVCTQLESLEERATDCVSNSDRVTQEAINILSSLLLQENLTITNANWDFLPGYNGEIYRTTSLTAGNNLVVVPFQLRALVDAPGLALGTLPVGFSPGVDIALNTGLVRGTSVVSSVSLVFAAAGTFSIFAGFAPAILAGDTVSGTISYQV